MYRWWRNFYALAARLLIVRLPYTIDFIFSSPSIFNIGTSLGFLTLVSLVSLYMPLLGCTIETNRILIFVKSHYCIAMHWGLPCNNSIGAWRHLLSLFSSDETIGNLSDNENTEFSPKKKSRCIGSKTAQNWSSKLFSAMRIFSEKHKKPKILKQNVNTV